ANKTTGFIGFLGSLQMLSEGIIGGGGGIRTSPLSYWTHCQSGVGIFRVPPFMPHAAVAAKLLCLDTHRRRSLTGMPSCTGGQRKLFCAHDGQKIVASRHNRVPGDSDGEMQRRREMTIYRQQHPCRGWPPGKRRDLVDQALEMSVSDSEDRRRRPHRVSRRQWR